MCGIVGYVGRAVGPRGRDRGAAAAGVPRLRLGRGRPARRRQAGDARSAPASWPTSKRRSPSSPLPAGDHRHRAHPVGHPRRAERPQRPPAPRLHGLGRRHPQRDHRELRPAAGRAGGAGPRVASDTDTEVVAHLLGARASADDGVVDLAEAMRRVCRRLEGAFTLVAVHADAPDVVVGARRNSPLVVGRGRRRELPRLGRRRVHRAHPRGGRARPGPGRRAAPRRRHGHRLRRQPGRRSASTTSTGTPPPPRRAATTTSCSRRSPSSRRPSPTRCSAASTTPGADAGRDAALRRGAARGRQDRHHRLRHGLPRRPGREVRHRALDAHPVRGRAGVASSATATRSSTADAGHRDLPVRRDDGHPDGAAARPRAAGAGAGDLQHQRLDDPARVRRRALHPRRPGGRRRLDQGVPHPARRVLPGRPLPRRRCAGTKYGDEIAEVVDDLRAMPDKVARVLDRLEPVRELAR